MKAKDLVDEYTSAIKVKDDEAFYPTNQDSFDESINLFDKIADNEEKKRKVFEFMSHCFRYRLEKGRWETIKAHKSLMLDTAKKAQKLYLDALKKTDDKKMKRYFSEKATVLWDDVRQEQEKTPTKDEIYSYLRNTFEKENAAKQKKLHDSI